MNKIYSFLILLFLVSLYLLFPLKQVHAQTVNDWPVFQKDSQHTGHNASETILTPPLTPQWIVSPENTNASSMVTSGTTLYVRFNSGKLYAMDISTGSILWTAQQPQSSGYLAVANNKVYAGSGCGGCGVDVFDANSGQLLFSTSAYGSGISSPLNIVGNLLYFGSGHSINAVNASTGNGVWGYPTADIVFDAAAIADGLAYVTTYQNRGYVFNALDGSLINFQSFGGQSSPMIFNNILYLGSADAGIYAYVAGDGGGGEIWRNLTFGGVRSSPAIANNIIYALTQPGIIGAFNANNGQTLWSQSIGSSYFYKEAVVVANGIVYVPSDNNVIYAFDGQTGNLVWQYTASAPIKNLIIANHTLFFSSDDGKIYAFSTNQTPVVNQLSNATINQGDTYTMNGSFTDPDSSSWTATVDYDDGAGVQPLTLSGMNFTLNHQYNTAGSYTVTVNVTDNQGATGTENATITVNEPEPITTTFNASGDTYVRSGQANQNEGGGQFLRVQSSGSNRGFVKFDQNALQAAIGNGQVLSAKLKLTITDNSNNWGATGRTVDVHRLIANWAEGNGTALLRGTGNGATWNCAIDSQILNLTKDCSGSTEWEMGQPNNPSVHPWIQTPTATQTITNNQTGVVEYDVTTDVASFITGTNTNYGWIVKKTNEGQNGQVDFGSRESSSIPQLLVTYQP